jgi:transposase
MAERGRPKAPLVLTDDERQTLQRWTRRAKTAQALALRARIVLACAEGVTNKEVAERLGIWPQTVTKWRGRFVAKRLAGLSDEDRPGRPRTIADTQVEEVITKTLEEPPPNQDSHWSTRSMARATGMSQTAISRIWRAFGLKPHLTETWKLSSDPQFIDKVRDVVGLYLDPPDAALVLCVDEKSQIQALDRTAPILPVLPTTPARRTHDYVRNGTASLFAALDVATGTVISSMHRRHRHQEFLKFLRTIDRNVPAELDVHLICDNYGTHKTPAIKTWLLRHPRFHLHFTPPAPAGSTSSNAGLPSSPTASCAALPTPASPSWRPTSTPGSRPGTRTPGRSCGPRPPMRSSTTSQVISNELITQDTSGRLQKRRIVVVTRPRTEACCNGMGA